MKTKIQSAFCVLALACALLSGCSTSAIVVGKQRPATNPEDVRIFLTPPKKYEEIAVIDSDSNGANPFGGAQGKMNAVVKRMKKKAAKLGANGIILTARGESGSVTVGGANTTFGGNSAFSSGFGVSRGGLNKTGSCIAVWVLEE